MVRATGWGSREKGGFKGTDLTVGAYTGWGWRRRIRLPAITDPFFGALAVAAPGVIRRVRPAAGLPSRAARDARPCDALRVGIALL